MENEEQAALRATLEAAARRRRRARAREARFSALLGGSGALLPYVPGGACADPCDRVVRDPVKELRVLQGGANLPWRTAQPVRGEYEPAPVRPAWVAVVLLAIAAGWFILHLLGALLMQPWR